MVYPSDQPAGPPVQIPGPAGVPGPDGTPGVPGPPGAEAPAGPAAAPFGGQWWRPHLGGQWWRLQQSSPRPWRRTLRVAAGIVVSISVLGVLLGLLWAWLAPPVPVINTGAGVQVTDPSPEQYIAADGWLTLLGVGFGLIVTIGTWMVLRRDRGPFLLAAVVGGTFVAGHWVAPLIGEWLGRDAYEQWRATAAQGATYLAPPEIHSTGPTLVPAFVSAIVLTLLAGWSNDPDLDQPGAHPGYTANHAYLSSYEPGGPQAAAGYQQSASVDQPGGYPQSASVDQPGGYPQSASVDQFGGYQRPASADQSGGHQQPPPADPTAGYQPPRAVDPLGDPEQPHK